MTHDAGEDVMMIQEPDVILSGKDMQQEIRMRMNCQSSSSFRAKGGKKESAGNTNIKTGVHRKEG